MEQIPDAPYIRAAEKYGTAYRDAYIWGGRIEDYDVIDEDDYEEEEIDDDC